MYICAGGALRPGPLEGRCGFATCVGALGAARDHPFTPATAAATLSRPGLWNREQPAGKTSWRCKVEAFNLWRDGDFFLGATNSPLACSNTRLMNKIRSFPVHLSLVIGVPVLRPRRGAQSHDVSTASISVLLHNSCVMRAHIQQLSYSRQPFRVSVETCARWRLAKGMFCQGESYQPQTAGCYWSYLGGVGLSQVAFGIAC